MEQLTLHIKQAIANFEYIESFERKISNNGNIVINGTLRGGGKSVGHLTFENVNTMQLDILVGAMNSNLRTLNKELR